MNLIIKLAVIGLVYVGVLYLARTVFGANVSIMDHILLCLFVIDKFDSIKSANK